MVMQANTICHAFRIAPPRHLADKRLEKIINRLCGSKPLCRELLRITAPRIAALCGIADKKLKAKPTSINKIHNELKSVGCKVSKDSLYAFAEYAEAAYFLFRINKFDFSIVKQERSEKKICFIDNGLLNSLSYKFSDNYGALLENAVYLFFTTEL